MNLDYEKQNGMLTQSRAVKLEVTLEITYLSQNQNLSNYSVYLRKTWQWLYKQIQKYDKNCVRFFELPNDFMTKVFCTKRCNLSNKKTKVSTWT